MKPTADFSVRLVGDEHPLKLYWGRDTQGRYLFIYDSSPEGVPARSKLPKLEGIGAAVARCGDSAKLVLILNETANWELFHGLCADLVRATAAIEDGPAASAVILRRLNRWQEFLRRARPGAMSVESIKGLIGELLFLSNRVAPAFGWDDALDFWKGPEGSSQDFVVHQTVVEVKCQAGASKPLVRITSVEQLDPQLPDGFLVVYTIATAEPGDPSAFSLNELVGRIRSPLQSVTDLARERFEDLIHLAGYSTSEEYDLPKFVEIAVKSYRLGLGFPRILRSSVPAGVDNVSYTVSLEACSGFQGSPTWWGE